MDISTLNKSELTELIALNYTKLDEKIANLALQEKQLHYSNKIYARGLIEFTNHCKNDCFYCGIRNSNKKLTRYRLTKKEILSCCDVGNNLGFSTFVLQGGEDAFFSDNVMCDIIYSIKSKYPDCAVTLSIGEKSKESYKNYRLAGADRFLLRHETANSAHYSKLHPNNLNLESRKKCLYTLKELGFQTGAGFMVGTPYQTIENLAEDLLFLKELEPEMVGIGPFIPHQDTPFKDFKTSNINLTITMLALTRLMLKKALMPATTALATLDPVLGRKKAFWAGANVVMPNLTPEKYRDSYSLYDNKLHSGNEAVQSILNLKKEIESTGSVLDMSRGDYIDYQ